MPASSCAAIEAVGKVAARDRWLVVAGNWAAASAPVGGAGGISTGPGPSARGAEGEAAPKSKASTRRDADVGVMSNLRFQGKAMTDVPRGSGERPPDGSRDPGGTVGAES